MPVVLQAFRFELDPSNVVSSALASHAGGARFAYNWGLRLVNSRRSQRRRVAEQAMCEGGSEREAWALADASVKVPTSLAALRREWNEAKHIEAPWWAENSKECYSSGLDGLARGLKAYYDSKAGRRKGPRVGWPKPRKLGGHRRFRVTPGSFGVVDGRHVRLCRIGIIRTKEPTTKLGGLVDAGTARILSATVSEHAGRWYVSFGCEVDRPQNGPADRLKAVGVDVGVSHLAVCSTAVVGVTEADGTVPNPKHLNRWARRQARLGRELSRRRGPAGRESPPSKRWKHTKARLARCHTTVANARADGLHKLTTGLARSCVTVVVEDLAVAGMTRAGTGKTKRDKAGLNRAILDASPAELRRQLAYKTTWFGSTLIVADRWYPSSKTCSACKAVKAKLPLACRTYRCDHCGLVLDRDRNAASNLASLAETVATTGTASGAGTSQHTLANVRGEERSMGTPRCSSANRQDGTSPTRLDKTVTATRQQVAPNPVLVGSDR